MENNNDIRGRNKMGVMPVGGLCCRDKHMVIGGGEIGKLTMDFYNTLTGIQWGRIPDTHGWIKEVCRD